MLRDRYWFRNLLQTLVARSFAQLFKKPLRRSFFPPPFILRRLQKFDGEFHVGTTALAGFFNETAHNRPELRRQRLLQILVTLPWPQRFLRRFLRFCLCADLRSCA